MTAEALTLETYTFNYSRSTGKMRFMLNGEEQLVDRIAGQWWALECDRSGSVTAECALMVKDDPRYGRVAYVFHPDITEIEVPESVEDCGIDSHNHDHCMIGSDKPFPQGRNSHWRLCYAREIATSSEEQPCWRLRDESAPLSENALWFVQGYEGPMNINYFDRGSHIFCDGAATVDEQGIAHFA